MIRDACLALLVALGLAILALSSLGFGPLDMARMFAHPIRGGTGEASALPTGKPAPQPTTVTGTPLGTAGIAVFGTYLVALLAIGIITGRRTRDVSTFFTARGRLNPFVVGLSVLATYLSALTIMGLSGMAFGAHDWTYMVQLPFLVLTGAVVTQIILPRYRKTGAVSIYELLEQNIHVSSRVIAAASFVIFAVGRIGLLLYLPALAVSTVTGFSLPVCIVAVGFITLLYTMLGGMEAVVWTDALQVAVFVAATIFTLRHIVRCEGVEGFLAVGLQHNKFRYLIPSFDPTKITTAWLILETIVQTIRIYGTQQDVVQRYLATPTTKGAAWSVWIGVATYIPLAFLFYFAGTALFVFYKNKPEIPLPAKADAIFPFFAVHQMPPAAGVLVIAAIFAASMSSIDSCMNSASTVCLEDFVRRFRKRQKADAHDLMLARQLTLVLGLLGMGMGFVFM
ncbi:MAG: hypothetical protein N2255_10020, partial [Kiritimatiellae bacterium]|nr:hypothetical protein [Kiritimatiellia bacterium]